METPHDCSQKTYLSAIEAAKFLGVSVRTVYPLVSEGLLPATIATSGQKRFRLTELERLKQKMPALPLEENPLPDFTGETLHLNGTIQQIIVGNAQQMHRIAENSGHLVVTSPPYFNTNRHLTLPRRNPDQSHALVHP